MSWTRSVWPGSTSWARPSHGRIIAEGKPGSTMRSESNYQTWWNGGGRTAPYFHNQIGILTEFIGNPSPEDPGNAVQFLPDKLLPYNDYPNPIAPQRWRLRQSIDYSLTVAWGILDLAAKLKENFLFNIYTMGKNSIDRGSRDNWTIHPKRIAEVKAVMAKDGAKPSGSPRDAGYPQKYYDDIVRSRANRDARGYIIPSDQSDFLTATKFVNVLMKGGVAVHRATQAFEVAGKSYPAGSYVVKAAQAYRPHLRTMFEPQDYPDDIEYPGGPPKAPYDITGWTLAFQMGVKFDSVFDGFDGPFEKLTDSGQAVAGDGDGHGRHGVSPEPSGQRRGHCRRRAASLRREGVLAQGPGAGWREEPSGGNDLHSGAGVDRGEASDAGCRAGIELRGPAVQADRGGTQPEAGADRIVGPVRRVDALRLDPLAVRAGTDSPSTSCTRRRWTPATCRRSSTCWCSRTARSPWTIRVSPRCRIRRSSRSSIAIGLAPSL